MIIIIRLLPAGILIGFILGALTGCANASNIGDLPFADLSNDSDDHKLYLGS